jgi:hypothetical protein
MMRMVMRLAGDVFHGPIAGHGRIAGADEGVAVWAGHVLEEVFGEKLPVNLDAQPVSQLGELDALFCRRRRAHVGGASGWNNAEEDEAESESHNAMTRHDPAILQRPIGRVNLKQ